MRRLMPYVEATWGDAPIPVYRCPSDSMLDGPDVTLCSYYINDGHRFKRNGFSAQLRDLTPSGFSDGLSTTAAFSERLLTYDGASPDDRSIADGHRYLWHFVGGRVMDINEIRRRCISQRLSMSPYLFSISGGHWQTPGDLGYDHILTPNAGACWNFPDDGSEPTGGGAVFYAAITAASDHSGHVNLLMADGSVRSVRSVGDSVSIDVWRAVGTRNGSETLALD